MKATIKKMEDNLVKYFDELFTESKKATGLEMDQKEFSRWFYDIHEHPCVGIVSRSGHGDWCFGFDDKDNLKLGEVSWGYGIGSFRETEVPERLMMEQDRFLDDIKHNIEDTFSQLKEIEIKVSDFKIPKVKVNVLTKFDRE